MQIVVYSTEDGYLKKKLIIMLNINLKLKVAFYNRINHIVRGKLGIAKLKLLQSSNIYSTTVGKQLVEELLVRVTSTQDNNSFTNNHVHETV